MAASGFAVPIELNLERRQRQAADAHQEHEQKINDLLEQRQALVQKIPNLQQGTPEYDQAHTALQGVIGGIQDFYHPQKNPGAIEKFGHIVTDHLKITDPQKRADQQAAAQQAKTTATGKATDQAIAAAPLSTIQTTTQQMQAKLDIIDKSGLSPEEKKEAKLRIFGVTNKPVYKLFDMPDGSMESIDIGHDPIPEGAKLHQNATTASTTIEGWQKAVEGGYKGSYPEYVAEEKRKGQPSTSAINEGREDYSKSHGFQSWTEIPDEYRDIAMNYMIRKQAMDKAYPTSTTTTSVKPDAEGQFRPVTETNYKTPQGTETLKDPLWFLAAPVPKPGDGVGKKGASSSSGTTPANPKDLKKEAEARKPQGAGTGSTEPTSGSSTGKGSGNTKVGEALFPGKNKEYDDAKTAYDAAIHRKTLMHKNMEDALKDKEDQQAMLSLVANHIGMTLGAQKGARINQAVWNEAVESAPWLKRAVAKWGPDGYLEGVTLTPQQMKQMVKLADESTDVTEQDLSRIRDRVYKGSQVKPPSGEGNKSTPDVAKAKGTVSIARAKTMEKYKGMTDQQISDAITKQGYIPTKP